MCGPYRLSRRKQLVEKYFDSSGEDDWVPRYNIAPTQPVPVIRQNPKEPRREFSMLRRGLIPSWTKDSSGAARMINARSETAASKPAFRDALRFRRCIIPADEFYEWYRDTACQRFALRPLQIVRPSADDLTFPIAVAFLLTVANALRLHFLQAAGSEFSGATP